MGSLMRGSLGGPRCTGNQLIWSQSSSTWKLTGSEGSLLLPDLGSRLPAHSPAWNSWNLPFKKWVILTTLDWISSFPYLGQIFTHISKALLYFSFPVKLFKIFFPTRLLSESLLHPWAFSKGSDFTFLFFCCTYTFLFLLCEYLGDCRVI